MATGDGFPRPRLLATACLAIAACGLCAVVLSQNGRGQIARLELGSDASLISVLDHSGPNNVHNAGELHRRIVASQLGEHRVIGDPGARRVCWVEGAHYTPTGSSFTLSPLVRRSLACQGSQSRQEYLSVPMSLVRVGTPSAPESVQA